MESNFHGEGFLMGPWQSELTDSGQGLAQLRCSAAGNEIQSDSVLFNHDLYAEECRGQVSRSGYNEEEYRQFGYGGVSP
jgi:hypothetical protein